MSDFDSDPLSTLALDALRDAVFVVGRDGRVLRMNSAAMRVTGVSWEDARGRDFESLAPMFAPLREHLARLRARPAPETLEVEGGGRFFHLEIDLLPAGSNALLFVLSEVSERKRMVQALKAQNEELAEGGRRKDQFLAMLAHELRNPLGALTTALHVLGQRVAKDDAGARLRDICRRQLENLTVLVDDLLDVSRITRGKISLRREPADLAIVIADAVQAHRDAFEARGLALAVSLPPHPVMASVDRARMDQILGNVLANASTFTPAGGNVALSLAVDGRDAVLRVRDDGVGIRAENLARVFDLFVQVDPSLEKTTGGGLGVGLTLVRSLVQLHEGSVVARSEGTGRGTEFIIRLPLCATQPAADPQRQHG